MYLFSVKANLTNLASTEKFIEHWDDTKCYRAILADKYYRQANLLYSFILLLFCMTVICALNCH